MNKLENKENELVDIATVKVDKSLPRSQRVLEFSRQIKDPYHFLCSGYEVTVGYSNTHLTFEECLMGIFF